MEPTHDLPFSDRDILYMVCRDKCGARCNEFYVENCPGDHSHFYHCKERFYPFVIEMFPVKEVEINGGKYLEIMGAHFPKVKVDEYVRLARHRARTVQYFKDLPKEEKSCWRSDEMDRLQRKLHKEIMQWVFVGFNSEMSHPAVALRAIFENYVDKQVYTEDGKIRRN